MTAIRAPASRRSVTTRNPCFERAQLVVHFHAQGLENLRRGVATPMAANNFLDRPGQRECFTKWRGLALLHNRTGDATRGRFFAEIAKKSGQFFFAVTVDDRIRGFLGAWIHPHVERTVSHQTETALGIFELAGRNTEIENRPANFTEPSAHRAHDRRGENLPSAK